VKRLSIVSGGQTGVDQAALDAARKLGLPCGGYIPRGRWTEDGLLPPEYTGMIETDGRHPAARTKLNVRTSDATLLISRGPCEGGTLLTLLTAQEAGKPHLHIDISRMGEAEAVDEITRWLGEVQPAKLNVAGPRASKDPHIYAEAKALLLKVLGRESAPPA
jgi:hypothetical protein